MSVSEAPPARSSRTTATLLAAAALIATFLAGMFAGALLHRGFVMHPPGGGERGAAFMMKRLDRRLDLTPQQEAQVTDILRRGHGRIAGVWNGVAPQIHREIELTNAEIEKILTPEQRRKFATIKMHMQPRRGGRGMRFQHD